MSGKPTIARLGNHTLAMTQTAVALSNEPKAVRQHLSMLALQMVPPDLHEHVRISCRILLRHDDGTADVQVAAVIASPRTDVAYAEILRKYIKTQHAKKNLDLEDADERAGRKFARPVKVDDLIEANKEHRRRRAERTGGPKKGDESP